jgi:hypothetical protein
MLRIFKSRAVAPIIQQFLKKRAVIEHGGLAPSPIG